MKTLIVFMILSLITTNGISQTTPYKESTKEHYLQKSKKQNTTAWVLSSAGSAIVIAGLISMDNSSKNDSLGFPDDSSYFILLGGTTVGLVSIPFFISSARNARKAVNLSINNQSVLFPLQNNIAQNYSPSIALKITF